MSLSPQRRTWQHLPSFFRTRNMQCHSMLFETAQSKMFLQDIQLTLTLCERSFACSVNVLVVHFNPLLHEFFFSSVLERLPKIGSYSLPTHRRCAQRNFFYYPFIFSNRNFVHSYTIVTGMQQRVKWLRNAFSLSLGNVLKCPLLTLTYGLLYHRTCKPDFLCSWPSLNFPLF